MKKDGFVLGGRSVAGLGALRARTELRQPADAPPASPVPNAEVGGAGEAGPAAGLPPSVPPTSAHVIAPPPSYPTPTPTPALARESS